MSPRIALPFVLGLFTFLGPLTGNVTARAESAPWVVRCGKGPTLRGIDVSSWQGMIDWRAVRQSGVSFAYIRVSDGATAPDPFFERNWQDAARAGLARGGYQYFRPAESPEEQADLFLRMTGAPKKGDLPPVLDVETAADLAPDELAARIERWVQRIRRATSLTPVLYTTASLWAAKVGNTPRFRRLPLWIAHHDVECPNTPIPWKRWTLHQSSASGAVEGIGGAVDEDVFQGRARDLTRLRLANDKASQALWRRWKRRDDRAQAAQAAAAAAAATPTAPAANRPSVPPP